MTQRARLRAEKKWKEADAIREALAGMGITLIDKKDGTTVAEKAETPNKGAIAASDSGPGTEGVDRT